MALGDQIEAAIRQDVRSLRTERINFEITRASLISAARQVEFARASLLLQGAAADPTSTLNILRAYSTVLTAKNALISSWVSYEITRYQLLLDMDALQLDERGLYADEYNDRPDQSASAAPPAACQQAGETEP
jgi:hypothetical protein